MSGEPAELSGPDFEAGIDLGEIADGAMLLGHAHGEAVLLARRGGEVFAIGAACSHYSGPLAEGLMVGDTVRCPLHHACFSLRTGEALRAPALNPVACWKVEVKGGRVFVGDKLPEPSAKRKDAKGAPASIVIVGGGAAGNAAAEMLRREGFAGKITMLSADDAVPCDRPNLSKDYLAGNASPDWIPLRPKEFYDEHDIDLRLGARVTAIDSKAGRLTVKDGGAFTYDALLLATGADPVHLSVPGADLPHVHYLRTLADSNAIIAALDKVKRAVVIGASFIGLEVAASLRARDIEVHVVGPEPRLFERVLGAQVGDLVRSVHESHGVNFHLGAVLDGIDATHVSLKSGERLAADLVVVGIGVRPATAIAEQAGIAIDRGVAVDEYLETSVKGIFAAGDIARWPDRLTGGLVRVEHWVVAERQGQVAALNMLGRRQRYDAVPFFWSQHFDMTIDYVGHAEHWDDIAIDGDLAARDCRVTYRRGGKTMAVVTIGRDLDSLRAEVELEARS